MSISDFFSDDIREKIKQDIALNNDHEIFFIAIIDIESKKVKEYNLLARGNSNMVPAIINDLKAGNIIVHNHPSGDLTPSAADIRIASRTGNNGIGFAIINNQVDQIKFIVEPKIPEKEIKLDKDEILSLFKPAGKLDKRLRDYEYREQQLEVVERTIDSFNEHKQFMIEAGTGTGKSFAYLIPALYWSTINKDTVVISTNTINLQEQLIEKDLILLKKVLPFSFKAILVKGRSNYVCKRKMKSLEKRAADIFTEETEKKLELVKILNWLDDTETGSRSELNFIVSSDLWDELKSESDLCMRTNCPYFNNCFFMYARKEVFSADLLIVNHHLLLSDAVLKKENLDNNLGILPKYKKLIVDEAHNLVEAATSHLGQPFYIAALNKYFQRLYHNKFSLIPRLRDKLKNLKNKQDYLKIIDNRIIRQIISLNEIGIEYYNLFNSLFDEKEKTIRIIKELKESNNWKEIEEYGENFLINIQKLARYLDNLYQKIMDLDAETIYLDYEELLIELESFIYRCKLFANNLDFNLKSRDPQYVFWVDKKGDNLINQENAPLDISNVMNDILWSNLDTVVLTSATLTVNNSFRFFMETLGLEKSNTFSIESPFDYAKQAELFIPDDIPPANSPDFLEAIIKDFKEILITFAGRTLVLFTSYQMLNYCVKKINKDLEMQGINLMAQGNYSRSYIIEHFKEKDKQIIFGTVSFWEGIDVKGENLQHLIIMKLPFPVPTEPIAAARMEQLQKEGKNPFFDYSIPRAVIRFKQGFGRLIRSKEDKGIVISFDNRLISKNYGKIFLNSLPKSCPIIQESIKTLIKKEVKA